MSKKRNPRYRQIEDDILEKITLGSYRKGDVIPTEYQLASHYNVSRVTVRKALDNLEAKNLINRVSGVGTFIKMIPIKEKIPSLMSFTEEILSMGMTPRSEVEVFQIQQAPENIAEILQIDKNDKVYFIQRIRYADDIPFLYETTHISAQHFPNMSIQTLLASKFKFFEETTGLRISRNQHTVKPIMPTPKIAKLFDVSMDTPLIKIENTTFFENNQVMDYTEQICNSPKYQSRYIKYYQEFHP